MLELISNIDRDLLFLVNGANTPFFDALMLIISAKLGWIWLYLILLYIIIRDFGKRSWIVLLVVAITIFIADQLSVHLFKNVFQRLRPCQVTEIAEKLHMVKSCGGLYGFVSSHAANSAAISTFLVLLLKKRHRWIISIMMIYTLLIMYSRVYLGVHYPTDVLAGAVLGILIGLFSFMMYQFIDKRI